jgi:hypothetical protein
VNKPNIALQWFKDGKPITDIKEQVDGLVHKLIIPKTEDKDKGVYTAKYQDLQTEANVEVLGKFLKMICFFIIIDYFVNKKVHQSLSNLRLILFLTLVNRLFLLLK